MARILVVSVVWSVSLAIIEDFVRTLLLSLSSSKKTLLLGPPLMVMGRSNENVFYLACCWMWLFVCQMKASGAFFMRARPIAVSRHQARPSSLGCHSHRRTTRSVPRRSGNTIFLLAASSKENDSTADRVSSPERYAQSLNLTIAQVQERIHQRQESVDKLQRQLQHLSNNNTNPLEKQALLCRHRYEHGQHPFVCRKCWTYQPICLCRRQQHMTKQRTMITPRPPCHSIVLWTHRQEWGSVSNTGSILPLILQNTRLLMKGLPEHEEEWKNLLLQQKRDDDASSLQSYQEWRLNDGTFHEPDNSSTSSLIPIVLWPQNNKNNVTQKKNPQQQSSSADSSTSTTDDTPTYWTMDDIRKMTRDNPKQQFGLVAVEGTWRQARRMVSSDLLRSFPRLSLPPLQQQETNDAHDNDPDHHNNTDIIKQQSSTLQQSLLAPLRNKPGSLCTAEAVAYALQALEWISPDEAEEVLDLARSKVDRVRRYQGKPLL